MSNLKSAFIKGKTFIPFLTCGDPDLGATAGLIREAVQNGAGIIQLGIPFSDPTAEGPVVQEANIRALAAGVTTDKVFEFVKELRSDVKIPIVFMTYANVVFSYGAERFIAGCKEADVNGIIIPDLPFEEKEEFHPLCKQYGVDLISMVAPASKERIAMIAKEAEGFLYLVIGGTGERNGVVAEPEEIVKIVRENTDIPCAVELGDSTPEQVERLSAIADGVIIRGIFRK